MKQVEPHSTASLSFRAGEETGDGVKPVLTGFAVPGRVGRTGSPIMNRPSVALISRSARTAPAGKPVFSSALRFMAPMRALLLGSICLLLAAPLATPAAPARAEAIYVPAGASFLEQYAAREARRLTYARTGRLLPLTPARNAAAVKGDAIVVARAGGDLARGVAAALGAPDALTGLGAEDYCVKLLKGRGREVLLISGGGDTGTLYSAYRYAGLLGARFYLHGETLPDDLAPDRLPEVDERASPLFALRGIQPFHDFPEGPDWWNLDDYLAILGQLPKLRMNFFGLHCYPEGAPNAEPAVWIGLPADFGDGGRVAFSYPASWQNTLRGNWGYAARRTGEYLFGAAQLFERDDFGAEVMSGFMPQPAAPADCNELFNRVGLLFRQAFTHARRLGIKTCVGTETPLTVPKAVQERLRAQGREPLALEARRALYAGIFRRLAAAHPLDYYWFWTPEGWTWEGTKPEQIAATTNDLLAALAAHREVKPPFALATCGWVLGPPQDRALFDKALPKDIAVSCINRQVGNAPVEPGFAEVQGRGKWAIPWLEDDPGLTIPQLWAGRMRRDAFDARRYGCDGLMGIHWRTRALGPNVGALAQAAWRQGDWQTTPTPVPASLETWGPVGGSVAATSDAIAGADSQAVYQTVRYNVAAYRLPLSNGVYAVTLKFCEMHYTEAGRRVFGVKLQGRPVIEALDVFARVGHDRALDLTFNDITVSNGWLVVDFVPVVEYPFIAGLSAAGPTGALKVNCGGGATADCAADPPGVPEAKAAAPPADDFYLDWALHEFGREVGPRAAEIFARLDGRLPRPADWVNGPGGIKPDPRPWSKVEPEYAFVDDLAALADEVRGPANRERFDYWLNTFRYLRAMARLNCVWAEADAALARVKAEKEGARQKHLARAEALPHRLEVVHRLGEVYRHLLAHVGNPGELGTVANWEQHLLPDLLGRPGDELSKLLGEPLPREAIPTIAYAGPLRVLVPTVRTSVAPGEALRLKIIVLAGAPPREVVVQVRGLGGGGRRRVKAMPVARGVYTAELPAPPESALGFEYHIEARGEEAQPTFYPPTAPKLGQTVTVLPPME